MHNNEYNIDGAVRKIVRPAKYIHQLSVGVVLKMREQLISTANIKDISVTELVRGYIDVGLDKDYNSDKD